MTQVLITLPRETVEQLVVALEETLKVCELEGDKFSRLNKWHFLCDRCEPAIGAGRAALAGAEPTGWIAAKDRMPPPQVRVLGFEPQYNIVDVDMWFGPDFNWGYSYWMPLPPAPKEQL